MVGGMAHGLKPGQAKAHVCGGGMAWLNSCGKPGGMASLARHPSGRRRRRQPEDSWWRALQLAGSRPLSCEPIIKLTANSQAENPGASSWKMSDLSGKSGGTKSQIMTRRDLLYESSPSQADKGSILSQ